MLVQRAHFVVDDALLQIPQASHSALGQLSVALLDWRREAVIIIANHGKVASGALDSRRLLQDDTLDNVCMLFRDAFEACASLQQAHLIVLGFGTYAVNEIRVDVVISVAEPLCYLHKLLFYARMILLLSVLP